MKQKKLNNILYVFDVNPYIITQDTSAEIIKVQEESYDGFVEMNPSLAEKIVKYNYHLMCVKVPEWAPYAKEEDPQDQLTFSVYGTGAADAINQIQVQNENNEVLYHWDAPDIQFPFQCNVEEGQHCVIECKDDVDLEALTVTGIEYLPVRWTEQETGHHWYATYPINESISIGINAAEPSTTHTVEITSDIAMAEIMEQTPDHQTIVNTYTSPSSPFTMTVNEGNIVTVEFDNGEPFNIYDIDPNGFFAGQWQNPDTGKYISWSNQIFDDVNVTIATPQPSTYTFVLEGSDIHQNVTVKVNGETTSYTPEQLVDGVQVNDGDVIDVYPTQNIADYSLASGATWDTDHWTATVNGADLTITINYAHDYSQDYLTFEALEPGTFTWTDSTNNNSINYSLDNGSTWNTLASGSSTPSVNTNDKVLFKASGLTVDTSGTGVGIGKFSSTGTFNASGNIMSLTDGDNFVGVTNISNNNQFSYLFEDCTTIVDASNLILSATTLAESSYYFMFNGCTSLTTAPSLPATTLARSCYSNMFNGCTSLTTAPSLPATTLAWGCYFWMFYGCTSLTTAPSLPATTLTNYCYKSMFNGCTSLTTAPELPATTLASSCYESMFSNCTSLNNVTCLAYWSGNQPFNSTYNWLDNVAASGTFTKDATMSNWTTGADGIPQDWTVQDYSA